MSVAVVQGVSGGIGLPFAQHILRHTSLKVYALTHRTGSREIEEQLHAITKDAKDRVAVLSGIDTRDERTLESVAHTVKSREGNGSIRLVACLAGIVSTRILNIAVHSSRIRL
jgi:NAD(P)-dependent dehydrogenase (short-subunit alcohol dehydrogenase family)